MSNKWPIVVHVCIGAVVSACVAWVAVHVDGKCIVAFVSMFGLYMFLFNVARMRRFK